MTTLSSIWGYITSIFTPPKATPTSAASATLSEFTTGAAALQTLIAAIIAKSFTLQTGEVVVEDVADIVADIVIPGLGAQLIAKVLPLLFEGLTVAAIKGVGAFASDPVNPSTPTQFSNGRLLDIPALGSDEHP